MAIKPFPTNLRALMDYHREDLEGLLEHALKNYYEKNGCGPGDEVAISIIVTDQDERMTISDPARINLASFRKIQPAG